MRDILTIPKENTKTITLIKELLNIKAGLRCFFANGGNAKDFKANNSNKK